MNLRLLSLLAAAGLFLAGCSNEASFSEKMHDSFAFTAAVNLPKEKMQCIQLNKPYVLKAGIATYTFPAGLYVGMKKNSSGIFYYSVNPIKSSNSLFDTVQGIYLDNAAKQGNFFGYSPQGFPDRPIRSTVLPAEVLKHVLIKPAC